MKFINPDINSSYRYKEMGRFLYDAVIESNAKKIVDIGLLNGYSTVCLALAAKQTGGTIYAYDLFDDYEYISSNYDTVMSNLERHNVLDNVVVKKMSFDDWMAGDDVFNVLHVDISNTGDTIVKLSQKFSERIGSDCRIFFEGGSIERDYADWMVKHEMKKITQTGVSYKVLANDVYWDNDANREYRPSISELL